MLGAMAFPTKEIPDFDASCAASWRGIGFMHDEYLPRPGIASQIPSVPVWAAVKLSRVKRHTDRPSHTERKCDKNFSRSDCKYCNRCEDKQKPNRGPQVGNLACEAAARGECATCRR